MFCPKFWLGGPVQSVLIGWGLAMVGVVIQLAKAVQGSFG